MRMTLNLDDTLLAVAKARATRNGLTLLPTAPGTVVTDEMVTEALDDE